MRGVGRPGQRKETYWGTDNPSDEIKRRVVVFMERAYQKNVTRADRAPGKYWHRPTGSRTATAKEGMGVLWLDCFRDYEGDECLLFPFRTPACPRGAVVYNHRRRPAHRAMCLMAHGAPKDERKNQALHSCGNGHLGCVNPNHLYWGNHSGNCKDAARHRKEGKPEALHTIRKKAPGHPT